jgi:two-component system chemotaxis response regulator CheB
MTAPVPAAQAAAAPIKVMIVDDSAVVRGMVARWLEAEAGIVVEVMAVDGVHALKKLAEHEVDICLLDIEMPVMSGLEALPQMLALRPGLRVIMASTLSERGAEVTLRALQLGAADFIAKPSANRLGGADAYRRDLVDKIRQLGRRARSAGAPASARAATAPRPSPVRAAATSPLGARHPRPEALVIAASTGGPPALRRLFDQLGGDWRTPILIAQHMPAEFTRTLARLIDQVTPFEAREAVAGEAVKPGVIYVAPGAYHLTVRRGATGQVVTALDQEPPINWCRPSADPLLASAAEVWGAGAVGLVLTGMGHDGRDGAAVLAAKGGRIIAQDEASSVVWGMPGAVVEAGLAERVLALDDIAPFLAGLARGAIA